MAYGRDFYAEDANELQPEHFDTGRKKIENDDEDFEDDEEFDEDEALLSASKMRESLQKLLRNPATWYVAGFIDSVLVATFYLHWMK